MSNLKSILEKFFEIERWRWGQPELCVTVLFLLFDGLMLSETLVLLFRKQQHVIFFLLLFFWYLLDDLSSDRSFDPAGVLHSDLLFCWFSLTLLCPLLWLCLALYFSKAV